MRKLLFLLACSVSAFAALPVGIMWNATQETGSAATNGGGVEFNATNLPTISSSTGATPIVLTVSSTTGYATGDAVCVFGATIQTVSNGCWFNVTVSGSTITLTGSVGDGTGCSSSCTGSVVEAYNLKTPAYVFSDAAGASTTTAFTATHSFIQSDRRQVIYISACTGGTGTLVPFWYNITTTAAGVATLGTDPANGTGTLTGCTWYEGGSILSPATILVAGGPWTATSILFIKYAATPYAITAGLSITAGQTPAPQPTMVVGYDTTLMDAWDIGHAHRPTIQIAAGNAGVTMISTPSSLNGIWVANLIFDCNSQTTSIGMAIVGNYTVTYNNKVIGCASKGIANNGTTGHFILGNEVTALTTAAHVGIDLGSGGIADRNWIHDTAGASGFAAIKMAAIASHAVHNVITNLTTGGGCTACIAISASYATTMIGNTIYATSGPGISGTYNQDTVLVYDNVIVNSGTYGFAMNTATPTGVLFDGNCIYNSGTANRYNDSSFATISGAAPYTYLFNATPLSDPFVNAVGGDFRLKPGSKCTGAGVNGRMPSGITSGSADFGALGRAGGWASAFSQ